MSGKVLEGLPVLVPEEPPRRAVPPQPQDEPAPQHGGDAVSGEAEVVRGPRFPDMFERALSESHLPEIVTVNGPDGSRRQDEAPPPARRRAATSADDTSADAGSDADGSAEIGPFVGASARRRRRLLR